jgi:beta-glucanase (GH16 family)
MKKFLRTDLVFLILVSLLAYSARQALVSYRSCRLQLAFGDDFNGNTLDTTKWNTAYPSGNGGEQQFYAPDAFTVQDGILKITAEQRSMQDYPYTSGIITTQDSFSHEYGYFTMRAKLPAGPGFWPAFWLLPIEPDYPTEIDIMEMLGKDPDTVFMSHHWRAADQKHEIDTEFYQGPDFSSEFHTFSLLWNRTGLIWYVDGVERYHTTEGIPDKPMFLLANLAVGGKWPGNPDQTTTFPSSMEIDYIQVYQFQCYPGWFGAINPLELYIRE